MERNNRRGLKRMRKIFMMILVGFFILGISGVAGAESEWKPIVIEKDGLKIEVSAPEEVRKLGEVDDGEGTTSYEYRTTTGEKGLLVFTKPFEIPEKMKHSKYFLDDWSEPERQAFLNAMNQGSSSSESDYQFVTLKNGHRVGLKKVDYDGIQGEQIVFVSSPYVVILMVGGTRDEVDATYLKRSWDDLKF